ncbi:hypothetical protein FHU30_005642 [Actinomadura rupiterrae]|nr:hypothetical protein [Actinomadura rupiterrae]
MSGIGRRSVIAGLAVAAIGGAAMSRPGETQTRAFEWVRGQSPSARRGRG